MPRTLGNAVRFSHRLPHRLHTRYLCPIQRHLVACGLQEISGMIAKQDGFRRVVLSETILEHFAGLHGTPGASLYSRGLAFQFAYRPLPHPHPEELQPPPNPNTPWVTITTLSPQPLRQSTLLIPQRRLLAPLSSPSGPGSVEIHHVGAHPGHNAFRELRTLKHPSLC